jgi:hypothetical protein
MTRGSGAMLCCLDASPLPSIYIPSVDIAVAIDTNINSSVDQGHFDEDTFSRLQ